jgi:5-methylcytosine-specific restriction enzyme A
MGRLRTLKPRVPLLNTSRVPLLRGNPNATPRLRGRRLQRLRARILARDPICVYCQAKTPPVVRASVEVDHRIPLFKGGTDADDNLVGTCAECHAEKSARERGAKPRRRVGVDGAPEGWK